MRRRCAARTSTRSSPRCGRPARRRAAPTAPRSAQRNALVAAIRAGRAGRGSLPAWDAELARHGVALMADRAAVVEELRPRFAEHAAGLGLSGRAGGRVPPALEGRDARRSWRPSSRSASTSDLERGFTGHGPHRDELVLRRDGPRAARLRVARAAAARAARAAAGGARGARPPSRGAPPLMLLDDVMSELDAGRRGRLVERPARAAARASSRRPTSPTCPAARARTSRDWRSPRARCCRRPA